MYLTRLPGVIGPLKLSLIFGLLSVVGGVAGMFSPPGPAYIVSGGVGIVGLVGAALSLLYLFAHRHRRPLRPAGAPAPAPAA